MFLPRKLPENYRDDNNIIGDNIYSLPAIYPEKTPAQIKLRVEACVKFHGCECRLMGRRLRQSGGRRASESPGAHLARCSLPALSTNKHRR